MRWKRQHFQYKDTIVTFLCEESGIKTGSTSLTESYGILEAYIKKDPEFRSAHEPYPPKRNAPELVKRMVLESRKMGVGPMAAVAGAFVDEALKQMLKAGLRDMVIDNGGDIGCFIQQPITMGLYTGNSDIRDLAFHLEPREEPFGICTSSGTVGHSFSYGKADAAVVVSKNIPLADAAATALANRVRSAQDLDNCFACLMPEEEIEGALVVYRDKIAIWGQLPELIRSPVNTDLITKGRSTDKNEEGGTP